MAVVVHCLCLLVSRTCIDNAAGVHVGLRWGVLGQEGEERRWFWLYKYEGIWAWAEEWVLGRGLGVGEVQFVNLTNVQRQFGGGP